jgi:amino acid transporter
MAVDAEKTISNEVPSETGRRGSLRAGTAEDIQVITELGYKPELARNRSMLTLLFQSLAIAAIPYGEGAPLISAIYGGGPLSIFVGWIVVLILDECIALSLGELASKYPTSAGPYYWSYQVATKGKTALSFLTGWTWLIGNCKLCFSFRYS